MKGLTTMATVLCTNCGINPVLAPESPEEDPLCEECLLQMNNVTHYDYYLAMTEAHDLRHPNRPAPGDLPLPNTPMYEFNNDEGGCPGWNDSCGNKLEGDADLCPDCTMGRMNAQSPLPGNSRGLYDYGTGGAEYYC